MYWDWQVVQLNLVAAEANSSLTKKRDVATVKLFTSQAQVIPNEVHLTLIMDLVVLVRVMEALARIRLKLTVNMVETNLSVLRLV
jgi:hypothetical protein